MEALRRKAISQEWLKVGEDALAAAESLRKASHFRSSVSRAYYAAYSFLSAALALRPDVEFPGDREGPDHKPLPDLVEQHLKSVLPTKARELAIETVTIRYTARLEADYRPRKNVGRQLAVSSLKNATIIAGIVRAVPKRP